MLGAANSNSQINERAESVPLLDVSGISKSFGANVVLGDVSLEVRAGESVAVIGENGAGKSTLAKILAGVIRPDAGELRLEGTPVSFHSPRDALHVGIGFIPQELAYFPDLSVAENIRVGGWPSRLGFISHRELKRSALQAAESFGIQIDLRRAMSTLKVGERQLVEIVKALSRDAKLLILDEPTAALTAAESRNLFRVLAGLAGRGHGILYISHRMDEVFRFSDRVDVLRNGQLVASVPPGETTPSYLIQQMLGQAARELTVTETAARGDQVSALSLRDWRKVGEPGLKGVSLEVARGEVVGIFGLRGSGAELVAEGIGGLHRDIEGVTEVDGRRTGKLRSPRRARSVAISYVPAERKRDGLVLAMSVQANLSLLVFSALSRFGFLRRRLERDAARRWTERLRIRFRSLSQVTSELSGGNQQKVMVASRLATHPSVFALQEPTRGVDVGARVELHHFVRDFAAQGVGVLIVTTDVEEAVLVTDRLLIMREGIVVAELAGEMKTQGRALALAAGEAA